MPFAAWAGVGATDTCGMDVTVSVSTVMDCSEPSVGLPFPAVEPRRRARVPRGQGGGALVASGRRSALTLPLSLPLSFGATFARDLSVLAAEASATSCCELASDTTLSSSFSRAEWSPSGEPRGLASCTVSRVEALAGAPAPRTGVRVPGWSWASSTSLSEAAGASGCSWGEGVGLCRLMVGGSWSAAPLRGGPRLGLLSTGGGDRRRGETGQRGASLGWSVGDDFWGTGARMVESEAAGTRVGVVEAEMVPLRRGARGCRTWRSGRG